MSRKKKRLRKLNISAIALTAHPATRIGFTFAKSEDFPEAPEGFTAYDQNGRPVKDEQISPQQVGTELAGIVADTLLNPEEEVDPAELGRDLAEATVAALAEAVKE